MVTRNVLGMLVVGLLAASLAACHPFESLDDPFATVIDDLDASNSDATTNVDAVDGGVSDGSDGVVDDTDVNLELPDGFEDPCLNVACPNGLVCEPDLTTMEPKCVEVPCTCAPGMVCKLGVCECKPGKADCDGWPDNGCETNLLNDPQHCGSCDLVCLADQLCIEGGCGCPKICPDEQGLPVCVDLQNDPKNCGSCENVCDPTEFCFDGRCECLDTLSECSGQCVELQTDPNHCGACGTSCAEDQDCCAGSCVALYASDPNNCGSCGASCPTYPHTSSYCSGGSCHAPCEAGFADCDAASPGCEVDLLAANTCGLDCTSLVDCGTGTCLDLLSDHVCSCDGQTACTTGGCTGSLCNCGVAPCTSSELCCASAAGYECTSKNSVDSCGACGNVCEAPATCTNGVCVCSGAGCGCGTGQTKCNGTCVSLLDSAENCGSCASSCLLGLLCVAGQCL